jgi:DNA polymerase-3 subunit delta'
MTDNARSKEGGARKTTPRKPVAGKGKGTPRASARNAAVPAAHVLRPEPPFPEWLRPLRGEILHALDAGRIPPGLLIVGPEGFGKALLARSLLQSIVCTQRRGDAMPCGTCSGCRSLQQDCHPDVLEVQPEGPLREIAVERIRAVSEFLGLSHTGQARIVWIDSADTMNIHAANALLKTLEEPPQGAMLLLTASRPARLPATVRSRCQQLRVPKPSPEQVIPWLTPQAVPPWSGAMALAASLDRPLHAWQMLEDPQAQAAWEVDLRALQVLLEASSPMPIIAAFRKCSLPSLLVRLQRLLLSAQRYLVTGSLDSFAQLLPASGATLARFAQQRGAQELSRLYRASAEWRADEATPLNPELRIEGMVLRLWKNA